MFCVSMNSCYITKWLLQTKSGFRFDSRGRPLPSFRVSRDNYSLHFMILKVWRLINHVQNGFPGIWTINNYAQMCIVICGTFVTHYLKRFFSKIMFYLNTVFYNFRSSQGGGRMDPWPPLCVTRAKNHVPNIILNCILFLFNSFYYYFYYSVLSQIPKPYLKCVGRLLEHSANKIKFLMLCLLSIF